MNLIHSKLKKLVPNPAKVDLRYTDVIHLLSFLLTSASKNDKELTTLKSQVNLILLCLEFRSFRNRSACDLCLNTKKVSSTYRRYKKINGVCQPYVSMATHKTIGKSRAKRKTHAKTFYLPKIFFVRNKI